MFEALNFQLFGYLNDPVLSATATDIKFAIFMANDTLYLLILFLLMAWLLGSTQSKYLAMKAVLTTVVALSIGFIIAIFYPHPRPFMLDMGHTLIMHAPTYSFPSNHMLIFSSIAFSYVFAQHIKFGLSLLGIAILVAWSRVYVGVHFPLDMLGALGVSLITSVLMQFIWNHYADVLMAPVLKLYQSIFGFFLQKGWLR